MKRHPSCFTKLDPNPPGDTPGDTERSAEDPDLRNLMPSLWIAIWGTHQGDGLQIRYPPVQIRVPPPDSFLCATGPCARAGFSRETLANPRLCEIRATFSRRSEKALRRPQGAVDSGGGGGRAGKAVLAALPATRLEAKAVGTDVLLGADATRKGLVGKLTGPGAPARWRSVHLACHGKVDSEHPLDSWLALAPAQDSDGFLTVLDVFGMRIPSDLAVLSACQTGHGKVYRSEGVVGFSRAFLAAGPPRVLVSLWEVDDEATRVFMEAFYAAWNPKDGKGGVPAAEALSRARAAVRARKGWEHPAFWGAWQLWGLGD